jgi:hypothetical protein
MGTHSTKCVIPFNEVSELDIQSEVGYTKHELGAILSTLRVNRLMEVALSSVLSSKFVLH